MTPQKSAENKEEQQSPEKHETVKKKKVWRVIQEVNDEALKMPNLHREPLEHKISPERRSLSKKSAERRDSHDSPRN
jgi:hypothetical protein